MRATQLLWRVGGVGVAVGALVLGSGGGAPGLSKRAAPPSKSAGKPAAKKTASTTKHFIGARIKSVTFTGSVSDPVITIRGSGLGRQPTQYPAYQPAGHTGCSLLGTGNSSTSFGYDYGTALYIHDSSSSPVWGAGRFRAAVGELDCVGVIVKSFTANHIVLTLGAAYPNYPAVAAKYALKPGDRFDVHVNGAFYSGRVHYAT